MQAAFLKAFKESKAALRSRLSELGPGRPLRVLVVDDSAVVREITTQLLRREPGFEVMTASDPLIATEKMRRQRPDVLLLDIEMPRMDGLTFLRKLMVEDPLPVVICSGLTGHGTELALEALQAGALDIVSKPRLGVRDFLVDSATQIVDSLRAAAQARLPSRRGPPRPAQSESARLPPRETCDQIVALGASTGGTEALRSVLQAMPRDAPGMAIVQHMPEHFTAAFAGSLARACRISVEEARDGERLGPGIALIAPGNRHLEVVRSGSSYLARVSDGPLVSRHRPSVDVLFESVARAAGPKAVGVIMTGMGDDGAAGLLAMRRAGAFTVAQDEESCVVFGMPREAILRGAVETVIPLGAIPASVIGRTARARG